MSQEIPSEKSIQFWVKDELFEEFEGLKEQLAHALSIRLGVPEEKITSYPALTRLSYNKKNSTKILVSNKALITIVVYGVEVTEIKKHVDMIIAVLSGNAEVKRSEVEIVQVWPSNSCLLVIRLPGLAMVRLMIAFLHLQSRPAFLHQLTSILPKSTFEVKFGFASLPYFSASLPYFSASLPYFSSESPVLSGFSLLPARQSVYELRSFHELSSLPGSRYHRLPSSTTKDLGMKTHQFVDFQQAGTFRILITST